MRQRAKRVLRGAAVNDLDQEEAQLHARLAEIQQQRRARLEAVVSEAFEAIRKLDPGQRRLAIKSLRAQLYRDEEAT
jgi:hypothetical protein